jgi:hypothetical protein
MTKTKKEWGESRDFGLNDHHLACVADLLLASLDALSETLVSPSANCAYL